MKQMRVGSEGVQWEGREGGIVGEGWLDIMTCGRYRPISACERTMSNKRDGKVSIRVLECDFLLVKKIIIHLFSH